MSVQQEHARQQYLADRVLERQRRWAVVNARVVARGSRQVLLHALALVPALFLIFMGVSALMGQELPHSTNLAASGICAVMLILAVRHSAKLHQKINKKNH